MDMTFDTLGSLHEIRDVKVLLVVTDMTVGLSQADN